MKSFLIICLFCVLALSTSWNTESDVLLSKLLRRLKAKKSLADDAKDPLIPGPLPPPFFYKGQMQFDQTIKCAMVFPYHEMGDYLQVNNRCDFPITIVLGVSEYSLFWKNQPPGIVQKVPMKANYTFLYDVHLRGTPQEFDKPLCFFVSEKLHVEEEQY